VQQALNTLAETMSLVVPTWSVIFSASAEADSDCPNADPASPTMTATATPSESDARRIPLIAAPFRKVFLTFLRMVLGTG
jgi:hypothetical protein